MDETLTLAPDSSEAPASSTAASEVEENLNGGDVPMPDAPAKPNGSDSDSDADASDSDSDSDDEAQQNLQVQALETELAADPSNYDVHVKVSSSVHTYMIHSIWSLRI